MWNIKNESFLKDTEWLTSAQIALSTGTSGNSEIPYYDHLALVSGGPKYNDEAGIYPKQSGNEELSWEQTWSNNIGLRLGFFNRVNLDIDFYHKKTTDMLMSVPESYAITGEGYRWDNIGAMVNRGVEVSVNSDIIRTKDFTWNLNRIQRKRQGDDRQDVRFAVGGRLRHYLCLEGPFAVGTVQLDGRPLGDEQRPLL